MIEQTLNGPWSFRKEGSQEWLLATVPGGVHTDLLALGRIPDPFVADNANQVQWIAECGWEYRRVFSVESALAGGKKKFLVCDGLDTLAEIVLNGQPLGKTNNMFRRWKWDVGSLLKVDENELLIHFSAPLPFTRARQVETPLVGGGDLPGGPHLRKAPYQWGWDWGPKLPPIGIWKDIRLKGYSSAKLENIHIRQIHTAEDVSLQVDVDICIWEQADFRSVVTITPPDGEGLVVEGAFQKRNDKTSTCRLLCPIVHPHLWWPNGCGSQALYSVEIALFNGDILIEQRKVQVGLRTLELRQQPDQWGQSFTFVVNGVPVFAKGANWIPSDSFPTRIKMETLEYLIHSAVDANMNMLRVWGGRYYPEEEFYNLCDRYGILLWQDFMFACGVYPAADEFAENVRVEAIEIVHRLRHHACLALWCGNNEMEQGWVDWGWNKPDDPANQRLKAGYDRMFHHLLPEVVAAEDPDHPYWPSSASSGTPFTDPNGQQCGDTHYWDVWHKRNPFTAYRQQFPRFMSEFGFQALPPFRTIQTFAPLDEQNMTSYVMEYHQRSSKGNSLIISQMADHFRMPKDFPSLVYLSMVLQAEGIRSGVEHWRRNMQRVSGTLYWQLNDCWPGASWSSIDYFGRWKALHYAARHFYAPILLSILDDGWQRDVHLTSDMTIPWEGILHWRLESLAGEVLSFGEETVSTGPLADRTVCSLDFREKIQDKNLREMVLVCELWQEQERISWCVSTFVPDKYLVLTPADLKCDVTLLGKTLTFTLSSSSLARFVELSLEGIDVIFSNNYFDLPACMTVRVTASIPGGWKLAQVRQALRIRSLYESYT